MWLTKQQHLNLLFPQIKSQLQENIWQVYVLKALLYLKRKGIWNGVFPRSSAGGFF